MKKLRKITSHKLHKIIRDKIGIASSKYSPSQKIDRTTYDICTGFKYFYGVMSVKYLNEIMEALTENSIQFDDSKKERGFIKLNIVQ